MKIEIVQRNYVAKEKLTDLIDKKVQKFEKYLDAGANAKVVLSKSGSQERYKKYRTRKNTCKGRIKKHRLKHQRR